MKTKHFILLICTALVMPLAALAQSGALGSSTNPFIITSLDDLKAFRTGINSGAMFTYWGDASHSVNIGGQGQYFKIADNAPWGIGISTINNPTLGSILSWEPIGTDASPFKGAFDGNNKVIGFRSMSNSTYTYAGLFGVITTGSSVKNITVVPNIEAATSVTNVGGVVAKAAGNAVIENCKACDAIEAGYTGTYHITSKIEAGCSNAGGIVGFATNGVTIKNCVNHMDVSSTNNQVGGIVGYLYGRDSGSKGIANGESCLISCCTNYGNVSGANNVGGIVGYLVYANLSASENYGNILGNNSVGGVVGMVNRNGYVSSCNNNGNVRGALSVGGIAGKAQDAENGYVNTTVQYQWSWITRCINLGRITTTATSGTTEGVGGIVGTQPAATTNPSGYTNTRMGVYVQDNLDLGNVSVPSGSVPTGGIAGYAGHGTLTRNLALGEFDASSNGGAVLGAGTCYLHDNYYMTAGWANRTYALYGKAGATNTSGITRISEQFFRVNSAELTLLQDPWTISSPLAPAPKQYIEGSQNISLPLAEAARARISVDDITSIEYATFYAYCAIGNTLELKNGRATLSAGHSAEYECYIATPTMAGSDTLLIKSAEGRILRKIRIHINAPRPGIDQPLEISTLNQLKTLRNGINSGNSFAWTNPSVVIPAGAEGYRFILTTDIDLASELDERATGYSGWTPIGSSNNNPFKGEFDGNGHMVRNMTMGASGMTAVVNQNGFFGVVNGGTVKNLKVHAVYLILTEEDQRMLENVGAVAGKAMNATIMNCEAYGIVMGGRGVGGIVGYTSGGGAILGCRNAASVSGQSRTGGIAGYVDATTSNVGIIRECTNIGLVTVTGTARESVQSVVGGIVGLAYHAELQDVMNAGAVVSNSTNDTYNHLAGGIVGDASHSTVTRALSVNRLQCRNGGSNRSMICGRTTSTTLTDCLTDYSMMGDIPSHGDGITNQLTANLLNFAASDRLGSNWRYHSGRYPTPSIHYGTSVVDSIASLPILLYTADNVVTVKHHFAVTPLAGCTWRSDNNSVLQVEGDSVRVLASNDDAVLIASHPLFGIWNVAKEYHLTVTKPIEVYTLLADGSICYSANNANEPRNDFAKINDNYYQLVVDSVNLPVGYYNYRVVGNRNTDEYLYPSDPALIRTVSITEAGLYKLTFVFHPDATIGSDILYCRTEKYEIITYAVTFKDWDGTVLKVDSVEAGSAAVAPSDPTREGYIFTGWDSDFSSVTSDLTVTATYQVVPPTMYAVTFKDWDGTVLKVDSVEAGSAAVAPSDPTREGYIFTGWDTDFSSVTSDLVVTATYQEELSALDDNLLERHYDKRIVDGKVYIVAGQRLYDSAGRLVSQEQ